MENHHHCRRCGNIITPLKTVCVDCEPIIKGWLADAILLKIRSEDQMDIVIQTSQKCGMSAFPEAIVDSYENYRYCLTSKEFEERRKKRKNKHAID